MNITAIIAEYNPFHNGHLHQIKEIKKSIPESFIVAIMSGNFVQRGEPAFVNKYRRAELAIDSGVDLVLQLPTIYSVQSAENFALGGLKVVQAMNCIDNLSFGIETSNFVNLYNTAKIQYEKNSELKELINEYMTSGRSYASSFKSATLDLVSNLDENDSLFLSNSILALEYLKSSFKLNLDINFLPIQRLGNNYLDEDLTNEKFNSATSIRKIILNDSLNNIESSVPKTTLEKLSTLNNFSLINDYYDILRYDFLVSKKDFKNITGYENGLDNLLIKNILNSKDVNELVELSVSKRYKKSRIQRYLINYLLGINKNFVDEASNSPINYIKVLGFNCNGKKILKKVKENSNTTIITKVKDFNLKNPLDKKLFSLEEKATDLYNLKNISGKREFEFKPYIKSSL